MSKPFETKNRSKFLLIYHLIFVVKYRKKLLKIYGDDIKQLAFEVAKRSDFNIIEMEVDNDHIHLMIESVPKISPLSTTYELKTRGLVKRFTSPKVYPRESGGLRGFLTENL